MSALQWVYLGVTLGPDQIHVVDRPGAGIAPGLVNLVPNGLIAEIDLDPDLFLSTWSLGESTPAAQDACLERGWLNAPRLVLADQRTRWHLGSDRILDLARGSGAVLEPVGTVRSSLYAFR